MHPSAIDALASNLKELYSHDMATKEIETLWAKYPEKGRRRILFNPRTPTSSVSAFMLHVNHGNFNDLD